MRRRRAWGSPLSGRRLYLECGLGCSVDRVGAGLVLQTLKAFQQNQQTEQTGVGTNLKAREEDFLSRWRVVTVEFPRRENSAEARG